MNVDREHRPRSEASARSLLLTVLGEFVLSSGGSAWTSVILEALGVLEIEQRNARQAIFRSIQRGLLSSERTGRLARLHLTPSGRHLLEDGAQRIYSFGRYDDSWDGWWLVVLCALPEEQRVTRNQLRTRLEFEGLGFLAPGIAISPHVKTEAAVNSVLKDLDLLPGAVVFRSQVADATDPQHLLHRAWDLDSLSERYRGFIAEFERRSPRSDQARFRSVVELVHAWRRFPFTDPELPARLLPRKWPGRRARDLFDERRADWGPRARAWFEGANAP